jgi:DNA-binding transcriptional LysR family regulator
VAGFISWGFFGLLIGVQGSDTLVAMFRLLIAAGVTVDKWTRMWAERVPGTDLVPVPAAPDATLDDSAANRADAGLLRLPVDRDVFHAVPLYTEATVVVVPRDHFVAAGDEVTLADLADEPLLRPLDDVLTWPSAVPGERPATTADAVPLVAAHAGLLVVPQSLARLHHRRDLTYRTVTDAPTSSVGLVWRQDGYSDLVEELIGIVRGRTANSTRGRAKPTPQSAPRGQTGRRRR